MPKNRSNLYSLLDRAGVKFTDGLVENHILIPFSGENAITMAQIVHLYSDAFAFFYGKFRSKINIVELKEKIMSVEELRGEQNTTIFSSRSGERAAYFLK